jgi:small subunit ribosomal protein S1
MLAAASRGLLHVSEMAWDRVSSASQVVEVGQEITVQVLRVGDANGQVALGLKQLMADPWSLVGQPGSTIAAGSRIRGTVERHAPFGVFVSLAPGITGLLPANETGLGRDQDLRKAFPAGRQLDVIVMEIDTDKRRIRLSVTAVAAAEEASDMREYNERERESGSGNLGSLADTLRNAIKTRTE